MRETCEKLLAPNATLHNIHQMLTDLVSAQAVKPYKSGVDFEADMVETPYQQQAKYIFNVALS